MQSKMPSRQIQMDFVIADQPWPDSVALANQEAVETDVCECVHANTQMYMLLCPRQNDNSHQ